MDAHSGTRWLDVAGEWDEAQSHCAIEEGGSRHVPVRQTLLHHQP